MADNEDKTALPVFHGDKDKTNARQIAGRVIDPDGFEKHYRTAPDGTVTRLDTKGGRPQVITEAPEKEDEPAEEFSGLAYVPFDLGAKLFPTVLLKLAKAARPLLRGKAKPRSVRRGTSFGYSMLAGEVGGLSIYSGSKVKCQWMHGAHKTKRGMLIWKSIIQNNVTVTLKDGTIVPISVKRPTGWVYSWASQYRLVGRNGSVTYEMSIPSRTVFLSGPKEYDLLPVQVTHSGDVIFRCSDSQTFADRPAPGVGVVTDLTRYFQTVVFSSSGSAETTTGKLESFSPAASVSASSNSDGSTIATANPCVAHRPWWDMLTPGGVFKDPNYVRVESISSAAINLDRPACADSSSTSVTSESKRAAFTKAAVNAAIVDVEYVSNISNSHTVNITQEYSNVGMNDPFSDRTRQLPYQYSGSRKVFKGSLAQSESASVSASVVIGSEEYPFFTASGSSGTNASKQQDIRREYFHPPYGAADDGTWDGIVDTQGLTVGKALENACGYTYSEMMGWSDIIGPGTNKEIKSVDAETAIRESHCAFEATGRFYLTADASLRFAAWVEFKFSYNVSVASNVSDKWKWTLPQQPPSTPVSISVALVAKHKGIESRSVLFDSAVTMPPPVKSVAYSNPYYFVPLYFGVAPAGEISADGADVCWTYQVPSIEPQPSFFNSLDTLLQGQQTSPYIAGFSEYEMARAATNRSSLGAYQDTVIASRRIKLREAGADWLFSHYGIDRQISLAPGETDPTKLRKYGFSNALYTLMFDTVIRFEADTNTIRYWLEDVDSNAVSPSENKNAFCFRM